MKYYWLASGLFFLIFGLCAALFWDMIFAAWLWGVIGGLKIGLFAAILAEERGLDG